MAGGRNQRRTGSADPSNVASKIADASTARTMERPGADVSEAVLPAGRNDQRLPAGQARPARVSIHISASPAMTVSTSSTG